MNNFLKGMTTGIVVGATTAAILMPKPNKNKNLIKSNAGKAFKAVGGLIDNFQSMID